MAEDAPAAAPASAAGPATESIAVYARLKPVGADRGDVTVPKRFGKQKNMQVCTLSRACVTSLRR